METIIIYTKYYLQAVEEILDTYELNIEIRCVPSYDDVSKQIKSTPNLRGVIFIEHRAGFRIGKAYKSILTTLDEIAEASKQPITVSILANTEAPRKIVGKIPTKFIDVYFTKFTMMNTDTLRFEGLAKVIATTIGVVNNSILLELDSSDRDVIFSGNARKVEFIKNCLEIVSVDDDKLSTFDTLAAQLPELGKLLHLRRSADNDEAILNSTTGLVKHFAKHAIERREGNVQ